MSHQHRKNVLAAYSLLEILITMAIFGLLSVALIQSLLQNIRYSAQITMRSQIRSEIDQTMSIIQRDIRNANDIDSSRCKETVLTYNSGAISCDSSCDIKNNNKDEVVWCFDKDYYASSGHNGAVAKWVYSTASGTWSQQFITSPLLEIRSLVFSINTFNPGAVGNNYTPYANIMVTLQAEHIFHGNDSDLLSITNQVKQISVTTRNYSIK